jgi:hypothetical protein
MLIETLERPAVQPLSLLASIKLNDIKVYSGTTMVDIFATGSYAQSEQTLTATIPTLPLGITPGKQYTIKCNATLNGAPKQGVFKYLGQNADGTEYLFKGALNQAVSDDRAFTRSQAQAGTSDLEPTLSDVRWHEFSEGCGIDAVTGQVKSSALKPFQTVSSRLLESDEALDVLIDFESVREKIQASTEGSYNISSVTVDQSNDYLGEIEQSALEMTYIAEYRVDDAEYELAPESGYQLTDAARELARNPPRFREHHGDYFVATKKKSSIFRATYALKARSASDLQKFTTSAGVSVEGLFSQKGSTTFENEASQLGIRISLNVHMIGVDGVSDQPVVSAPSDIPGALAWFKAHQAGVPHKARLVHYSQLIPGFPTTVDVAPQVFIELRQLYAWVWQIRVMHKSLPAYYSNQTQSEFFHFDTSVSSQQSVLPIDKGLRDALSAEGHALLKKLTAIRSRQRLYANTREARATEPKQNTENHASTGTVFWSYGTTFSPDPENIKISKETQTVRDGYHIGWRKKTLAFEQGSVPSIVVGWEVRSNWADGSNGYWEKATPTNLWTNQAAVFFKSQYDRGFDWTVSYYYVAAADYAHFDGQ